MSTKAYYPINEIGKDKVGFSRTQMKEWDVTQNYYTRDRIHQSLESRGEHCHPCQVLVQSCSVAKGHHLLHW